MENPQREQCAERSKGKAGQNRERVDETLVQNAEHHINHEDGQDE